MLQMPQRFECGLPQETNNVSSLHRSGTRETWESGKKRHRNDRYQSELLELLRLQSDNEPAVGILKGDVSILVQGRPDEPLHAHKFILASISPVFCKMFNTNMVEQETGILRIDDATLPVMRAVIGFCYNAKTKFRDEVPAEEVLEVAHKYGIGVLVKLCEDHLVATISTMNLPKRLRLARKFQAAALLKAATDYFKRNFDAVLSDVLEEFDRPAAVVV